MPVFCGFSKRRGTGGRAGSFASILSAGGIKVVVARLRTTILSVANDRRRQPIGALKAKGLSGISTR